MSLQWMTIALICLLGLNSSDHGRVFWGAMFWMALAISVIVTIL
jgi:hypothetical protein